MRSTRLVRRGDARRRVRSRTGPGRECPIRERGQLRRSRPRRGGRVHRRPSPGQHRQRLVRRTRRPRRRDRRCLQPDLRGRSSRGDRILLLLRRRRLREPRRGPLVGQAPGRLPCFQPVGDLGGRHQPRHRPPGQLRVRDLLGHPARPARGKRQLMALHPARDVPGILRRRQWGRGQHRLQGALLSARCGALQPGHETAGWHYQSRRRCA